MKHYEQGQDSIFEDKPLEIKNNNQILKYEISVEKFGELNITTSTTLKNLFNDFFFFFFFLLIQGTGLWKLTGQLTLTIMYFIA